MLRWFWPISSVILNMLSGVTTVSARHRTLLVYEENQSHVIKNVAARVNFDM